MMNIRMFLLKLRDEEIKPQDIVTVIKYEIYAVGKIKAALPFKPHRFFFSSLSSTLLLQSHFTF